VLSAPGNEAVAGRDRVQQHCGQEPPETVLVKAGEGVDRTNEQRTFSYSFP